MGPLNAIEPRARSMACMAQLEEKTGAVGIANNNEWLFQSPLRHEATRRTFWPTLLSGMHLDVLRATQLALLRGRVEERQLGLPIKDNLQRGKALSSSQRWGGVLHPGNYLAIPAEQTEGSWPSTDLQ